MILLLAALLSPHNVPNLRLLPHVNIPVKGLNEIIPLKGCPKTRVVNTSGLPWVAWDESRKNYCARRCQYEYTDAPCLKIFVKTAFQTYHCICGA
jgi:hypothetical protein